MHSLVKGLMTTEVVTVGPAARFKEIVLRRILGIDPDTVTVEVGDGVVTLTGRLERSSLIPLMASSDLLIERASTVRRRI